MMPITETEKWQSYIDANPDRYGGACIAVARAAMDILDEGSGAFDCDDVMRRADKRAKTGGITGFMSGCVASMVSQCHSRGEEFRRKWNLHTQIGNEGERANESGGTLNPALLIIDEKE